MVARTDELIGTLPPDPNQTGSPALAGQPPAITGANPAVQPTPQTSGAPGAAPALASASPGSGSADIGAPLSNEAPEQQAGAGANLNLVEDRGTPEEYWKNNLSTLGSQTSMDLMTSAANAASGKTGAQAEMDPEEVRRAGVMANAQFLGEGGNTREGQDKAVEGVVYTPMAAQLKDEMETGIISEEDAVVRMAQTQAQVEGPQSEDELQEIVVTARKRMGTTAPKKDEKDGVWTRMKGWWAKGKDDPDTKVREDETEEVTRFMGGMTRQELGLFVFQWGALMMANADKGFGGAMGAAGLGATGAHLGRQTQAGTEAREQQKVDISQQRADAATRTAAFAGQAQGFTNPDGKWVVPKYDPETGQVTWEIATDAEGNEVEGDPDAAKDYSGEKVFLDNFLTEAGWSKGEIADFFGKAKGEAARRQDLTDALMRRIDNAGIIDVDPITGKKLKQFKKADIEEWVDQMISLEFPEEGPQAALPAEPEGGALNPENNKSKADYLNAAQTG